MTLPKEYGISEFAREFLIVKGAKCGQHCDRATTFSLLVEVDDKLVGAYVCPDNYVSRVVYFSSKEPDREWFESFLKGQVGERLRPKDLRFATRHGWELGSDAEMKIRNLAEQGDGIKEYYWTFYAKTDEDKRKGTFLCSKEHGGCGRSLFTKELADTGKVLCQECAGLRE